MLALPVHSNDRHDSGLGIGPSTDLTYIGPTFAQVQVGPKRRAFLVRTGDNERLRDALLGASTIWGGARCPVLPVDDAGTVAPFWLQVAELLQVCEFVDFTGSDDGQSAWNEATTAQWPVVPARPLEDGRFWAPHPIVTFDPDTTMMFRLPESRSLRSLAAVGDVAIADERTMWAQEGVGLVEHASERQLVHAQIQGTTVLDATIRYDYEASIVNPMLTSIGLLTIIDDPEDFEGVVKFWNFRALRPRGYRTGVSVLASRETLSDPEVCRELLDRFRATSFTKPDIAITGSLNAVETAEFAASIGLIEYSGDSTEQIFSQQADSTRTLTYEHGLRFGGWIGERSIGPVREVSIALQRPVSQLRAKSPLAWNPKFSGHGPIAFRFSAPELAAPPRQMVAQLFHEQASFQSGLLQINVRTENEYNFTIGVPSEADILIAACAEKGASFTLNDKGQQVRGIASVGIDLDVFRDADSIAAIQALTPEPDRDLKRRLQKLVDEGTVTAEQFDEFLRLSAARRIDARTLPEIRSTSYCSQRGMDSPRVSNVLNGLVSNRLALRGWRVDCDICSLRVFQEIHLVTPRAICPGCGSRADYAVSETGEPRLYYRLNTLLQRVTLNGGLAVLAATSLLVGEGSYVVPGANMVFAGSPAGDLDLLGWRERKIFSGEVKVAARGFARQNVERDVKKSVAIGADVHIAACLEEIPAALQDRMSAACEAAGVEFRCLDAPRLLFNSAQEQPSYIR